MQRHVDFLNPDVLGDCARPVLTKIADGRLLTLVRLLARQAAREAWPHLAPPRAGAQPMHSDYVEPNLWLERSATIEQRAVAQDVAVARPRGCCVP